METICTFNGMKEISIITSISEANLPEYDNMRRIYLRSKQEVKRALAKGNRVYQERVKGDFGECSRIYIEVPFDKLIDCAEQKTIAIKDS